MSTTEEGNSPPKANFDEIIKKPLPPPPKGSKGGQLPDKDGDMPRGKPAYSVGKHKTDEMIAEGGGRKRSRRRSKKRKSKRKSKKRRSKRRKSTKRR